MTSTSTRVVIQRVDISKQMLGAQMLSEIILNQLESEMKITVTPQYKVKQKDAVDAEQPARAVLYDRSNTTASYDHMAKLVSISCAARMLTRHND